jgi:hypothetical protein
MTRAPPPSNTSCHAGMTFGSALEFSHSPWKRRFEKCTMGEAGQRLRQARLAGMAGGRRDPRPTKRQPQIAFIACSPGAARAMAKLPRLRNGTRASLP